MNKRKTVLFLLSVLLAGWAVYSCSMDELEAPAFEDSGRYGGFGAREARAYFEANATDLSVPCFDPKPGSKSSWRDNIELIPEWGEAIETGHSAVSLIEVPLKSYTDNIGKEILVENGEYGKDHQQKLTRRLIIARHDTCQTDMFIITIVPSMDYGGDVVKSVEDFRYLGGGDFTGYVFCSTLEGEFVKAFGYTNGRCNGRVNAIPSSRAAKLKEERPDLFANAKVFRFQELPRLSQKTYTKSSDWGDDDWCSHGYPPGGCSQCSTADLCIHGQVLGFCSYCNARPDNTCRHGFVSECPFCNGKDVDDVVVTGCPGCGGINGCTCQICPACLQKEYQCRCTYCTRCHKPMSLCDCFIYPDPDPDPTPGGGGSGGGVTPGTDDGDDENTSSEIPDPCEGLLMDGIMDKVLNTEGGYVNDPNDRGGHTNRGVAWGTWQDYAMKVLGVEPTLENLKLLTEDDARKIYKEGFWDKAKIDEIDDPDMRFFLFDFYINAKGNAIGVLQKTLNSMQSEVVLDVDKAMGPKTLDCLNKMDHKEIYNRMLKEREMYYKNLVASDSTQVGFLKGWLNRVKEFNEKTDENKYNVNC